MNADIHSKSSWPARPHRSDMQPFHFM